MISSLYSTSLSLLAFNHFQSHQYFLNSPDPAPPASATNLSPLCSHTSSKTFPHCLSKPTDSFLVGLPGGLDDKESVCNAGGPGLIPGSGRSPGEGNGNPPQYSCLENPISKGAWRVTVTGDAKSQARLRD